MKRYILLLFVLLIVFAELLADTLPPQKIAVVFVPDSFVRVGFSDDPVLNSVEPEYMAPTVGLSLYPDEGAIRTDKENLYLYTQIFTTYPMVVEISDVKPLTAENTSYNYAWHADFTPEGNSALLSEKEVSSSDSVSTAPVPLAEESSSNADLSKPRTYCWNLVVYLSPVNGGLPTAPSVPVGGSLTINVRSV